ncbi:MAG: mannan-binding protein [Polyangiales bacterium]
MTHTTSTRTFATALLAAFGASLLAAASVAAEVRPVNAGPLWNNAHATRTCPNVCARAGGTWNQQWRTTVQGRMSVCDCAFPDPQPAPNPELIVNGGFEQAPIAPGSFQHLPELPGWRRSAGDAIEVQRRVAGAPGEGEQFVELDAASPSAIYQDVAVTAGASYELSFLYSPRPGVDAEQNNAIEVRVNGERVMTLRASGRGLTDTHWMRLSVPVRATGASLRVEFRDVGAADGLGGYLDGVSLVAAR